MSVYLSHPNTTTIDPAGQPRSIAVKLSPEACQVVANQSGEPMITVQDISNYLEAFAPAVLAEEWDNVGLLVGNPDQPVERLMTCLTITPESAQEAIDRNAEMIVTHHPLPFRPLKRLTTTDTASRLLLQLIEAKVAIHSPHTAFDSAAAGINQQLAEGLGLKSIKPLVPSPGDSQGLGSGRWGKLPEASSLQSIAQQLKTFLSIDGLQAVGNADQPVTDVAVACGSAGQFLEPAIQQGCDLLITGETSFHTCLEAAASQVALLLPGHYASERFAVEQLATTLATQFGELDIWSSESESDPLRWWN